MPDTAAYPSASESHFTCAPRISSPVSIQAAPGAAYNLYLEGETDPKRRLKIYADADGMVRFHVQPSAESEGVARFVIERVYEGREKGKAEQHLVHLRASHSPTEEMPSPAQERALAYQHLGYARKALSIDEALQLSDEQALAGNYPLRPNADEAPRTFHTWLRAVTTPTTVIKPHLITNPDISHGKGTMAGPATSNNWSGFELDRSFIFSPIFGGGIRLSAPYDWVAGEWNVPSVTSEINQKTYSALWVGLDGDGLTDLVQAGTEQECLNVNVLFINFNITTYYAWTEFLPQQPTEQVISNFPVSPGDLIFTEVWMGNAGSSPTLSGAFGVFFIENLSKSISTFIYTPVGTTRVSGAEAVWIMERPTVGGSLPDLANYGSAIISSASARQANSAAHQGYLPYQGARGKQISMLNGADVLSTVSAIDAYRMRFNWQRFN